MCRYASLLHGDSESDSDAAADARGGAVAEITFVPGLEDTARSGLAKASARAGETLFEASQRRHREKRKARKREIAAAAASAAVGTSTTHETGRVTGSSVVSGDESDGGRYRRARPAPVAGVLNDPFFSSGGAVSGKRKPRRGAEGGAPEGGADAAELELLMMNNVRYGSACARAYVPV